MLNLPHLRRMIAFLAGLSLVLPLAQARPPQKNARLITGDIHGTASYVPAGTAEKTGAAAGVILRFAGSRSHREGFIVTDEKGKFAVVLRPGTYCMSAYTIQGQRMTLAPKQTRCLMVHSDKTARLDVLIVR